jgi:hypothetical protein
LFTDNETAPPGASHLGRPYNFVARNYRPDHLAILPDQRGACSIEDGCGLNTNRLGCAAPDALTAADGCDGCRAGTGCDYALYPGRIAGLEASMRTLLGYAAYYDPDRLEPPATACPEIPGRDLRRR